MANNDSDDLRYQAEEVGCFGLISGVAKNLYTHQEFYASECTKKDGPFYCPSCYSDAIVHKCIEKIDHFAHATRLSPVIPSHESDLHLQCKEEICELLRQKFPDGNWATEREIPERKDAKIPRLVPDVSGKINDHRVVIEVQASSLSVSRIIKRTTAYAKRNISILWIVPLYEPLGGEPFRPRLYERYLHSIYYGRIYYWWAGQGLSLKPVHYAPASRYIERREWIEDGMHMSGGGFDADFKIIKAPLFGKDAVIDLDFYKHTRPSFKPENEKKTVPDGLIWLDRQPLWWKEK